MSHNVMVARIHAEFLEMPGLRLTLAQAQRLCGVERAMCQAALRTLVESNFLCVKHDGTYARLTDGHTPAADAPRSAPQARPGSSSRSSA
jgi:hypothetical protein